MRFDGIESEALDGVAYDPASRTLAVKFHGGGTYEYYGVDEQLYEELLSAQPHPWAVVGEIVKSHRYRRVQ
jgi:hypothetical protein